MRAAIFKYSSMCGRVFSTLRTDQLVTIARTNNRSPNLQSRHTRGYNLPPTSNLPTIVHSSCLLEVDFKTEPDADDFRGEQPSELSPLEDAVAGRRLTVMRWGWLDSQVINCRAEELAEKPMFRPHLNQHRCVVVVEGAFEWSTAPDRQAFKYVSPSQGHLLLAGLFNSSAEVILLTVQSNDCLSSPATMQSLKNSLASTPGSCPTTVSPLPNRYDLDWP